VIVVLGDNSAYCGGGKIRARVDLFGWRTMDNDVRAERRHLKSSRS
jgi:hypothetical protein